MDATTPSAYIRGPKYNVTGEATSLSSLTLLRAHLPLLRSTREELKALMPRACGCAHEQRIAEAFTEDEYAAHVRERKFDEVAERTLCPGRKLNPACAHYDENRDPDPLGPQIRVLSDIGVLDRLSWIEWQGDVGEELLNIDKVAARTRYSLFVIEAYQYLQQPHVEHIVRVRDRLVGILDRLIASIENMQEEAAEERLQTASAAESGSRIG